MSKAESNMKQSVIVDACRTPIGKFGGSLAGETAIDLGETCLRQLLLRLKEKIPEELARREEIALLQRKPYFAETYPAAKEQKEQNEGGLPLAARLVEEAIVGNVLSAGLGQNPARQIILRSGIPRRVPAFTLNQVCASGMQAVIMSDHLIRSGLNQVMLAGGVESMSNAPHLLMQRAKKHRLGDIGLVDSIMKDGLSDAMHQYPMGVTAENLARHWKINRQEQDAFAYYSQQKASRAEKNGRFAKERISYLKQTGSEGSTSLLLDHDEFIRHDAELQGLAALRPVFAKDGSVTAGNASGINDGASFLYLMEAEQARAWEITPLATIIASVTLAIDETVMGYSPNLVIRELLRQTGLSWKDIAAVEINEAFAVQVLSVLKDLDVSEDEYWRPTPAPISLPISPQINPNPKVNPWGGGIALGHPIGCSGARIITTLAHTLCDYQKTSQGPVYGIAALCVGGGQGCGVLLKA